MHNRNYVFQECFSRWSKFDSIINQDARLTSQLLPLPWSLLALLRIVTNSSAADGCMPTVMSKWDFFAPALRAMAIPCMISGASGPTMCTPITWAQHSMSSPNEEPMHRSIFALQKVHHYEAQKQRVSRVLPWCNVWEKRRMDCRQLPIRVFWMQARKHSYPILESMLITCKQPRKGGWAVKTQNIYRMSTCKRSG